MRKARDIWVNIIRQFERSGLTQERFADERGIPVNTLRSWIYRLRRDEQDEAPLLPVRVIASTAPTARQDGDEVAAVEIVLVDGLRVRMPAGTPVRAVAELLALLREQC